MARTWEEEADDIAESLNAGDEADAFRAVDSSAWWRTGDPRVRNQMIERLKLAVKTPGVVTAFVAKLQFWKP